MRLTILTALVALLVCACGRNDLEVRSYDTPKQAPMAALEAPVAESQDNSKLKWATPAGWSQGPASAMRVASFETPGKGNASIVVLGGEAGGLAPNVNRWRGQIGLAPATEQQILASSKTATGPGGQFRWFKLVGSAKNGESILAAIIPRPDKSIFVKLTATRPVLEANQEKFLGLCKSIRAE